MPKHSILCRFKAPIVLTLLVFLSALSALGLLKNSTRKEGQNVLGGIGSLKQCNPDNYNFLSSLVADDSFLYFLGKSGALTKTLQKTAATGQTRTVCSRILCDHHSLDCPLHSLLPKDSSSPNYVFSDGFLYLIDWDEKDCVLYQWDPATGNRKECFRQKDSYEILKDSDGFETVYLHSLGYPYRINGDTLLLFTKEGYLLLDNSFRPKKLLNLPFSSNSFFSWEEDVLFFLEPGGQDFYVYSLSGDEVSSHVLENTGMNTDAFYVQPVFFAYDRGLLFQRRSKDSEQGVLSYYSITSQTIEDLVSADFFNNCCMFGDDVYYSENGIVHRLSLKTRYDEPLPLLSDIPFGTWKDLLLVPTNAGSDAGYALYSLDGTPVTNDKK